MGVQDACGVGGEPEYDGLGHCELACVSQSDIEPERHHHVQQDLLHPGEF